MRQRVPGRTKHLEIDAGGRAVGLEHRPQRGEARGSRRGDTARSGKVS